MKKLYSFIYLGLGIGLLQAQSIKQTDLLEKAKSGDMQKTTYLDGKVRLDQATNSGKVVGSKKSKISNRAADHSAFVKIGETYYDLQTNYAMPHRLITHDDGSHSATWITSPSGAVGFPGRGAGYNFRNASTDDWQEASSERVEESSRSGWPNIGVLSDGNTFTIGHDAGNGGFYMTKSTTPGARPSVTNYILSEKPYKPIWSRTGNAGDTIHLICSYTDSAAPGESRAPTRKGIFAPMVYSRSFDGGETWNITHQMLPQYDSTLTNNGGADQYAIDVKGDVVAIANADLMQGVVVWKSEDAGETWRRYLADSFPYAPFTGKEFMVDTPYTADGTIDVLIDPYGQVHAFWGLARVYDDDTSDQSYSFYPGYQGIVYWNEGMSITNDSNFLIAAGGQFDRTEDGIASLAQATTAGLQEGNVPTGLSTVARLGNTSAMRQPSAGCDDQGNIFVTFSVPMEEDLSFLDANFRDIGIVHSTDGGSTWATPQNITQVIQKEDDFACIAREVGDFVHVMWQQDEVPGTNLQNNSALFANHEVMLNTIYYQAIPKASLLTGEIGMLYGVNTEVPGTGDVFVVGQNFPNPFNESSNVIVYLSKPGDITLEIRNTTGALVHTQSYDGLLRGNHNLEINANNLKSGVYNYSVIAGGSRVTKTMMVTK